MILVIGGDKGGTGKTTLAASVAVCLMKQGKAVALVKTDNNNSISDWYEERQQRDLPLFPLVECFGKVESEIKMLDKHSDVVVVDTAGYDSHEFRSALQCANLLISPVRPSSPTEVNSLSKLNGIIRQAQQLNSKLEARILLYRCKSGNHKDRLALYDFLTADSDWTQPLKSFVTHASVFDNAMNEGKGIHEMRNAGKAKAQIELVLQEAGV